MRSKVLSLSPALVSVIALVAIGPMPAPALDHAHAPAQLIVGFVDSTPATAEAEVHSRAGARRVRTLTGGLGVRMAVVSFDIDADLSRLRTLYRSDPSVAFAHPDYIGGGGYRPQDTAWFQLWHHRNVGQSGGTHGADLDSRRGWDISRGNDQVVVAVLDSGIDSDHTEFVGRIVAGFDFVNNDADPEDDHSHGTSCTGLLAANADNQFATAGVDHFCKIMPVKVLNEFNSGLTSDLIDGLGFASTNGAEVISMSLINYPGTAGLLNALTAAEAAGSILVACAGNGGIGDADQSFPGAAATTISIGATDDDDDRASFSGTGSALEFVAPGSSVLTVAWDNMNDTVTQFSGCSAATPLAAGIVSILVGIEPTLTTAEVRAILQAGAEDEVGAPGEDTPGWDEFMGWGRLNLRFCLQQLIPVDAPEIAEASGSPFDVEARPNPARGGTSIRFGVPVDAWVKVTVHDVTGRRVRELFDGVAEGGRHGVAWDGLDGSGRPVAPGVYFARVESSGRSEVGKVAIMR
jgi:subtilisin family serine protease